MLRVLLLLLLVLLLLPLPPPPPPPPRLLRLLIAIIEIMAQNPTESLKNPSPKDCESSSCVMMMLAAARCDM